MKNFAALLLLSVLAISAQDLATQAQQAATANDHAKAAELYAKLTQEKPADGNAWEQLGMAQQALAHYKDAAISFQRALDAGFPPMGKYNLACALARAGDKQQALKLLAEMVKNGAGLPLATDADLVSLHDEPAFKALLQQTKEAAEPCLHPDKHPEYRQLDFWIGDWDVFAANGSKVGESHIELTLKKCVIVENWTGLGSENGSGKSYNEYDPALGKWQQFWVADSGNTSYFLGEAGPGEMRYVMERQLKDGRTLTRHMTFSKQDGGKVRQFSQRSLDGKTWVTEYDFMYVPKKG